MTKLTKNLLQISIIIIAVFLFAFILGNPFILFLIIPMLYFAGINRITILFVFMVLLVFVFLINYLLDTNPADRINQANDARRQSDLNLIANAINQYKQDNNNQLPRCFGNPDYEIPIKPICLGTDSSCCDLSKSFIVSYLGLEGIPNDLLVKAKSTDSGKDTGYMIYKNLNGAVCLEAPLHQLKDNIKVCH